MPIHVTFPRLYVCRLQTRAFSVGFAAKVIATFDDDDEKDANIKTMVKKSKKIKSERVRYRSQLASIERQTSGQGRRRYFDKRTRRREQKAHISSSYISR